MASIFEDLLDNLELLVPAIVAGGASEGASAGYNYNWPAQINLYDMALVKSEGPYMDCFIVSETPNDEDRYALGGLIEQSAELRIEIGYRFDKPASNPLRQGQINCMKCYDDLKRLFGQNLSVTANGNEGVFSASRYSPAIFEYPSNDQNLPVRLHTFWRFKYFADRRNPDLRGVA